MTHLTSYECFHCSLRISFLIFIYLYSKNLEQEKYTHLSEILEKIAEVNKMPIDEIFHSSNEEIIPINEMKDRNQKVVIFDDYVCEKNQEDIIFFFLLGRHKNCCVIYLSESYYIIRRLKI